MHSIYSWGGSRRDNGSAECILAAEGEGGGLFQLGQTHREKCGRSSGDARVMDEGEAPLLTRVWRGRV